MKNAIIFIIASVCCASSLAAPNSENLLKAELILIGSDVLVAKRIGYEGKLSDECWALNYVLRNANNPRLLLDQVFDRANHVSGKIYAVVGLIESSGPKDRNIREKCNFLRRQHLQIQFSQKDIIISIELSKMMTMLASDSDRHRVFIVDGKLPEPGDTF